jgi:ketosteroid isomerase-like protein
MKKISDQGKITLILLCSALACTVVRAQANLPDPGGFVRDFYAVYNATGSAKLADFYTTDATLVDPTFELSLKGREEIGALLVKVLAKYESLDHEVAHTSMAGDDLIVEGTMVGKLGGKIVRVPFVSVFHFAGGKISAQRDMFDTLHFMVQLGVFPSPFQAKPAVK